MNYRRTEEDLTAVIKHAKLDDKNITKITQVWSQVNWQLSGN